MAANQGFQPCAVDTVSATPTPNWERSFVIVALLVHVVALGLDLLVVLLFLTHLQWGFFFTSAGVILWAWLASSLYVSFGAGSPGSGDIDDSGASDRLSQFFLSFVQAQIFSEAYQCVFRGGDTDYFHTLRLLEAIFESAPNACVKLYAMILWAGTGDAPEGAGPLLRLSVLASFISVGLGLAMWEQKVQFRIPSLYIAAVASMRAFEIASRSTTLAVFAGLTQPYGFVWAFLVDYCVMLFLIVRHRSVQLTYGVFVALPLTIVSLEPHVWRREDHAVPKDSYYAVRILELVAMWIVIVQRSEAVSDAADPAAMEGCKVCAIFSTVGLYLTLPCVWRVARRHELSRDVVDWGEDDVKEGLHEEGRGSDSDFGSSGDDAPSPYDKDELPPE